MASAVDEPKVPLALQPADNAAQVRSLHLTPLSGLRVDPSRLSIRYTSPPQVQASVAKPVREVRAPVGKKSKPKQAAPRFSHLPTPLALHRVPSEATAKTPTQLGVSTLTFAYLSALLLVLTAAGYGCIRLLGRVGPRELLGAACFSR